MRLSPLHEALHEALHEYQPEPHIPKGWRVDHYDWRRDIYTLARERWWGGVRVVTGHQLWMEWALS